MAREIKPLLKTRIKMLRNTPTQHREGGCEIVVVGRVNTLGRKMFEGWEMLPTEYKFKEEKTQAKI
jgi:hypothetical protein